MKKLLFLLSLMALPVSAMASIDVYTYGLGDVFSATLEYLQTIINSDSYRMLMGASLIIGLSIMSLKGIMAMNFRILLWGVFVATFMFSVLYQSDEVKVTDFANHQDGLKSTFVVDNAPVGAVAPYWLASTLGEILHNMAIDAFSVVSFGDYNSETSVKQGFSLIGKLLESGNSLTITEPHYRSNFSSYFENCTLYGIYHDLINPSDILLATNIWEAMKFPVKTLTASIYKKGSNGKWTKELQSCDVATTTINGQIRDVKNDLITYVSNKFNLSADQVPTKLSSAYSMILSDPTNGSSSDLYTGENIALQNAMVNLMNEEFAQNAALTGTNAEVLAINTSQAIKGQETGLLSSAILFMGNTSLLILGSLEIVALLFFPILVLLSAIPGFAGKSFMSYFKLLLWIALVPLTLEFVSFISYTLGDGSSHTLYPTLASQPLISEATAQYKSVAAFLVTLMPLILWRLISSAEFDPTSALNAALSGGVGGSVGQTVAKDSFGYGSRSGNSASFEKYNFTHSISTGIGGNDEADNGLNKVGAYSGTNIGSINGYQTESKFSTGLQDKIDNAERSANTEMAQAGMTIDTVITKGFSNIGEKSASQVLSSATSFGKGFKETASQIANNLSSLTKSAIEQLGTTLTGSDIASQSAAISKAFSMEIKGRSLASNLASFGAAGFNGAASQVISNDGSDITSQVKSLLSEGQNDEAAKLLSNAHVKTKDGRTLTGKDFVEKSLIYKGAEAMAEEANERIQKGDFSTGTTMATTASLLIATASFTPAGRAVWALGLGAKTLAKTKMGQDVLKTMMSTEALKGVLKQFGFNAKGRLEDSSKFASSLQESTKNNHELSEASNKTSQYIDNLSTESNRTKNVIKAMLEQGQEKWMNNHHVGAEFKQGFKKAFVHLNTYSKERAHIKELTNQLNRSVNTGMSIGETINLHNKGRRFNVFEVYKPEQKPNNYPSQEDIENMAKSGERFQIPTNKPNVNIPTQQEMQNVKNEAEEKGIPNLDKLEKKKAEQNTANLETLGRIMGEKGSTPKINLNDSTLLRGVFGNLKSKSGDLRRQFDDKLSERLEPFINEKHSFAGKKDGSSFILNDAKLSGVFEDQSGHILFELNNDDGRYFLDTKTGEFTTSAFDQPTQNKGDLTIEDLNKKGGSKGQTYVNSTTGEIFKFGSEKDSNGYLIEGPNSTQSWYKAGVDLNQRDASLTSGEVEKFAKAGTMTPLSINGNEYFLKKNGKGYDLIDKGSNEPVIQGLDSSAMAEQINGMSGHGNTIALNATESEAQQTIDKTNVGETVFDTNSGNSYAKLPDGSFVDMKSSEIGVFENGKFKPNGKTMGRNEYQDIINDFNSTVSSYTAKILSNADSSQLTYKEAQQQAFNELQANKGSVFGADNASQEELKFANALKNNPDMTASEYRNALEVSEKIKVTESASGVRNKALLNGELQYQVTGKPQTIQNGESTTYIGVNPNNIPDAKIGDSFVTATGEIFTITAPDNHALSPNMNPIHAFKGNQASISGYSVGMAGGVSPQDLATIHRNSPNAFFEASGNKFFIRENESGVPQLFLDGDATNPIAQEYNNIADTLNVYSQQQDFLSNLIKGSSNPSVVFQELGR